MLKQALDENSHIICLGDLNNNFMVNLPTTINDIVVVNGLFNVIDKPTHFDKHTGNISLLDRDSRHKFESNHILSSVRIVTSLVGIHSLAIVKKASVKFEQALLTSYCRGQRSF
jgi:hypothetical protein